MYTYKNISKQTHTISNVGVVKPGETVTVNEPIVSGDFELVTTVKVDKQSKRTFHGKN